MSRFVERSEIETGFAAVFEAEIQPKLADLETQRQARWKQVVLSSGGILGGAVILAILMLSVTNLPGPFALMVLIGGAFGAFKYWQNETTGWGGNLVDIVMPSICKFIGDLDFDRAATTGVDTDKMKAMGLLDPYNRQQLENQLSGLYRGVAFELVEAKLVHHPTSGPARRKGRPTARARVTFNGLLYRISVPKPAPTPILIARNFGAVGNTLAGLFKGKDGRGMPKVETGHTRFEASFELHAETPDAALGYLPREFLDTIVTIGVKDGGQKAAKGLRAAFSGSEFYLALETDEPFLEMGWLNEPIDNVTDDLHNLFDDIAQVRRIIDRLIDA